MTVDKEAILKSYQIYYPQNHDDESYSELYKSIGEAMDEYAASLIKEKANRFIKVIEEEKSACLAAIKHTEQNKSMIDAMEQQIAAFDICLKHLKS